MSTSIITQLEDVIRQSVEAQLPIWLRLFGVQAKLYHRVDVPGQPDVEDDVYGPYAGTNNREDTGRTPANQVRTITITLSKAGMTITNNIEAGMLEEYYVWTMEDLIPGDVLDIQRRDGKQQKLVVIPMESIGLTHDVAHRFKAHPVEE